MSKQPTSILRDAPAAPDPGRAQESLRLLADAGTVLSSSLDYETTLRSMAGLVVPRLADWCVIDVVEDGGEIRRVAIAHVDPDKADMARVLALFPTKAGSGTPASLALAGGGPFLLRDVKHEPLSRGAQDPEHDLLIRAIGATSVMVAPLKARGHCLGMVAFITTGPRLRYEREDLALAGELALRAAVAVDNAKLFHEAQRAVRLRDDFLSIASHELRTPLTALQLQVQGLRRAAAKGQDSLAAAWVAERTEKAARNVERLSELIDGLLDVSRLTSGQLELHLEPVDLSALVREVAERFAGQAGGAPLTVRAELPAVGSWDRFRLEQVVTTLLANAIKYGLGREIVLEVASSGPEARLQVTDHGLGISAEAQQRLFRRFGREVSSQQYGGFGLGLWIARQIVEALGGRIGVQSQLDRGSTFTVELPRDGKAGGR